MASQFQTPTWVWASAGVVAVGGGGWVAWKWWGDWRFRNDPAQPPVFPVKDGEWPTRPITEFGFKRSATHTHQGVDIHMPVGTPVYASVPGKVVKACTEYCSGFSGYGRVILIESPPNKGAPRLWWLYTHLDTLLVSKGDEVKRGQQIGTVGKTCFNRNQRKNMCNRPHLHFEISPRDYPQGSEEWRYDPEALFKVLATGDKSKIATIPTTQGGPLLAGVADSHVDSHDHSC